MPIKKLTNIFRAILLIVLPSISMTACGENYIPLGEYRIEWDEHNPKLHGQKLHFKVPMVYVILEDKHIGDYLKEEVAIGRTLRTEEGALEPGGAARKGYLTQQVDDGMEFTVKASYWHRRDWFERELVHDLHKLILVDENGMETTSLFTKVELYSDRPDLVSFEEIGRFK